MFTGKPIQGLFKYALVCVDTNICLKDAIWGFSDEFGPETPKKTI